MKLYRVFPHLEGAEPSEPGGALYVPTQGGGRLDNPSVYSVFYAGDTAEGAIAEAFGRFPEWSAAILDGPPALPGSWRALASFTLDSDAPLCNLDDAAQLTELGLRPSDVLTRDYSRSRAWALRIYRKSRWAGIRWWSYYDPDWSSFGLWDTARMTLDEVLPLAISDAAVLRAARAIARPVYR